MTHIAGCPLCDAPGGRVVVDAGDFRVIHAPEPGFPAFYRVVWTDHVPEFSDLVPAARTRVIDAVTEVERVLRRELAPAKVNLASLGNAVPHLHWHVIPRFAWDSHFPGAIWAQPQRAPDPERLAEVEAAVPRLDAALRAAFGG